MVKLKPLSEKSWLVLSDNGLNKIAILSEQKEKFILIAKDVKTTFDTKDEVSGFFNVGDIFDKIVIEEEKKTDAEYFVKGYPVDFDDPYEADPDDKLSELPLYTKSESSEVYYAAGYYCLKFPKGWLPSFCPKLATLDKYEYQGPFKLEREMKSVLAKLRKCQQ
jgi:hypothetical protein